MKLTTENERVLWRECVVAFARVEAEIGGAERFADRVILAYRERVKDMYT